VRRAPVIAVVLVLLAAACSGSGKPTARAPAAVAPSEAPSTTTTTLANGARPAVYDVGSRQESYVDTTRPTMKNGTYAGAPTRTIRVRFYYPGTDEAADTRGGPYPLILFSHGHNGSPEDYGPLLESLAKAGFVVAAPAYPLSNPDAPGGPIVGDLGNQAGDASFVIDRVLAASAATGWLHRLVDPNRIAAAGHSLGGFTTSSLAFGDKADRRVKAAVVMAASSGVTNGTPLLQIHGSADGTVPYQIGSDSYTHASKPKFFLTLVGGSHSGEVRGGALPAETAVTNSIIAFLDRYVSDDPAGVARLRAAGTVKGLTTLDAQP
jgi:poly(3-hydroxybutyrate) depolymerase